MEKEKNYYVVYSPKTQKPVVAASEEGYAKSLVSGICLGGRLEKVSKKDLIRIIEEEF